MNGAFGLTSLDDGCDARTPASGKNGMFAGNDGTAPSTVPGGGNGLFGRTTVPNASGVFGANDGTGGGAGVTGFSARGDGVDGRTQDSGKNGMFAGNDATVPSTVPGGGNGIFGRTTVPNASGVFGANDSGGGGAGVTGFSAQGDGVDGRTQDSGKNGMFAGNDATVPSTVPGGGNGIFGRSTVPNASGVFGANDSGSETGSGVSGFSSKGIGILGAGGHLAGRFVGDVEVTGDIRLVNADIAEDFCIAGSDELELGTVMVLDAEGALRQSQGPYDKCVAGVLSGAGSYKPGIILDKQESPARRLPIALVGKVYCKVDAGSAPIQVGDLLTTSPTPGHAMKATDPQRAFGSVIGKALRPLKSGQGLVPILIALQ
jgi:hypothetical protein